jgi:hypothetical protein
MLESTCNNLVLANMLSLTIFSLFNICLERGSHYVVLGYPLTLSPLALASYVPGLEKCINTPGSQFCIWKFLVNRIL